MANKKLQTISAAHKNNELILPNGETVSLDTWKTRLNNNVLVYGGSGAGKTRSIVTPNLLAMNTSYIVSDTKGNQYNKWSEAFRKRGYTVRHLNFIHPELSDRYDPLNYVNSPNDVQKLAHQIVYSGNSAPNRGNSYDPFWDSASELLLTVCIAYIHERKLMGEKGSFIDITRLITEIDPEIFGEKEDCEFDRTLKTHRIRYRHEMFRNRKDNESVESCESWAYQQYLKLRTTPQKTMGTIMIVTQTIISQYDTEEIRRMLSADDIKLSSIGQKKTVVFVEISDTDRSKDTLANIFYSQAMNQLCSYADEQCEDSRLPVPVRFILDDFGTNCRIDGFENMISNIRSREISATIILQSNGQLFHSYGDCSGHTIIDNCDTILYLGGNDIATASMIAVRCNKPMNQVLNMPVGTNWIIRRGEEPRHSLTVDLNEYDTAKYENPELKPRKQTKEASISEALLS